MANSPAYSFLDVHAGIVGPFGSMSFEGESDEGISCEYDEAKSTMTKSADGSVMHSLHAANTGTITVRCIKTSPTNALLNAMYNAQRTSASNWGQNTISVYDSARGDSYVGQQCAFQKHGNNTYGKEGNVLEWVFDVGQLTVVLGGRPG